MSGPSMWHREGALALEFTSNSSIYGISPDGKWRAEPMAGKWRTEPKAGDWTGLRVWDNSEETGVVAATFSDGRVNSVSFSPDSKRILSSSQGNIVRVRNLNV
jgi:WD40 repeat protein